MGRQGKLLLGKAEFPSQVLFRLSRKNRHKDTGQLPGLRLLGQKGNSLSCLQKAADLFSVVRHIPFLFLHAGPYFPDQIPDGLAIRRSGFFDLKLHVCSPVRKIIPHKYTTDSSKRPEESAAIHFFSLLRNRTTSPTAIAAITHSVTAWA